MHKNSSTPNSILPSRSTSSLSKKTYSPIRPFESPVFPDDERQQESIEQLKSKLDAAEEKLELTEKHIKLYEKVMMIKDTRNNDECKSIFRERQLLAEEKKKLLNLLSKAEVEKERIHFEKESLARQKSQTFYEIEVLEQKKYDLEKSIAKYSKAREIVDFPDELTSFQEENPLAVEENQFQKLLSDSNDIINDCNEESPDKHSKTQNSYEVFAPKIKEKDQEAKDSQKKIYKTQGYFDKECRKSFQMPETIDKSFKFSKNSLNLEKIHSAEAKKPMPQEFCYSKKHKYRVNTPDIVENLPKNSSRAHYLALHAEKKYRKSADFGNRPTTSISQSNPGDCTFSKSFITYDMNDSVIKNEPKRSKKNTPRVYEKDKLDNFKYLINELENKRIENVHLKMQLENYRDNLMRYEDIEDELETYKIEFNKCKRLLEMKEKELNAVLTDLNTLKSICKATASELKETKIELSSTRKTLRESRSKSPMQQEPSITTMKNQLNSALSEISSLKKLMDSKQKELENAQNSISVLKTENEYKTTELNLGQYKLSAELSDKNSLKVELNMLQSELASNKLKIQNLKQELSDAKQEVKALGLEKNKYSKDAKTIKKKDINDRVNEDIEKNRLAQYVIELENRVKEAQVKIDSISKENLQVKKINAEFLDENQQLKEEISTLREKNNELSLLSTIYEEKSIKLAHSEREVLKIRLEYQNLEKEYEQKCEESNKMSQNLNIIKENYAKNIQDLELEVDDMKNSRAYQMFSKPIRPFLSIQTDLCLDIEIEPFNRVKLLSYSDDNFLQTYQSGLFDQTTSRSTEFHQKRSSQDQIFVENPSFQESILALRLSEITLKSEIECLRSELDYAKLQLNQATAEFIITITPLVNNADAKEQLSLEKAQTLESELQETCNQLYTARNELMSCQAELLTASSELIRTKGDLEMAILLIESYKSDSSNEQNSEILSLTQALATYKNQNSVLKLKVNELEKYISRECLKYQQELEKSLQLQDKREKENLQLMIQLESSIKSEKYHSMIKKNTDVEQYCNESGMDLVSQNEILKKSVKMLEKELSELYSSNQRSKNEAEMYRTLSESLHTQLHKADPNDSSDISDSEDSKAEGAKEKISSEIDGLRKELEQQLSKLRVKEKEIKETGERLKKERFDIKNDAEYVKKLTQELEKEKADALKEKQELMMEKMKIAGLNKKLEEKNVMITKKEEEVFLFREQIEERERLVKIKERNMNSWAIDAD